MTINKRQRAERAKLLTSTLRRKLSPLLMSQPSLRCAGNRRWTGFSFLKLLWLFHIVAGHTPSNSQVHYHHSAQRYTEGSYYKSKCQALWWLKAIADTLQFLSRSWGFSQIVNRYAAHKIHIFPNGKCEVPFWTKMWLCGSRRCGSWNTAIKNGRRQARLL